MRLTNKLAPKITIGVGDSSNDISMLENVDFPIVPQSIQYYISNTNKVIAPRGQVLSDVACDEMSQPRILCKVFTQNSGLTRLSLGGNI